MENILLTTPKKFFERPEIMDVLTKRINAFKKHYRQNIALLGQQSLGKTSLIFEVLRRCKSNEIISIYIEVNTRSVESFAHKFIGVLLYQYLSTEDKAIEDDIDYLIEKSKEKIPKTTRGILQIKKLLKDKAPHNEIYSSLLELSQILYDEVQKPVLLILDEFHNLEQLEVTNPFLELSNKIMVQKNTMYIVISSAVYTAEKILLEKLSLLFGNFEIIKVQHFPDITAKQFIDFKLQNTTIPENLKYFLVYFSGGYPFYLDVITDKIRCLCWEKESNIVTESILLTSLTDTMFKSHGVLNQFFNNNHHKILDNRQDNIFTAILLAIADGNKKPSQLCNTLNKKSNDINRHLNKLIQMDIISKKGVFIYLNDLLFLHWIKFVLRRKQNSFNINIQDSINNFESEIKKLLNNFIIESTKGAAQRLKELFSLFENDIIELDKKKFILTRFDEIDLKDINSAGIINARRLNKSWLCYVEKKYIDETKIGEFLDSVKKRKNCIKKILIALEGIDANARLKALEARTWIWDQDILNELLSIFEKPRFIK